MMNILWYIRLLRHNNISGMDQTGDREMGAEGAAAKATIDAWIKEFKKLHEVNDKNV